jgi:hypothetical protein
MMQKQHVTVTSALSGNLYVMYPIELMESSRSRNNGFNLHQFTASTFQNRAMFPARNLCAVLNNVHSSVGTSALFRRACWGGHKIAEKLESCVAEVAV